MAPLNPLSGPLNAPDLKFYFGNIFWHFKLPKLPLKPPESTLFSNYTLSRNKFFFLPYGVWTDPDVL